MNIPLSELNAAVERILPMFSSDKMRLERMESTGGSIRYALSSKGFGHVGEIVLQEQKGNPEWSDVFPNGPTAIPGRSPTTKELTETQSASDPQNAYLQLLQKIGDETDELNRQRKEYFDAVVETFIQALEESFRLSSHPHADDFVRRNAVRRADAAGATKPPLMGKPPRLRPPEKTQAAPSELTANQAATNATQSQLVMPNKADSKSRHYDVFISYSSSDEKIAARIAGTFQAAGLECWLDKKDILVGEQILDRVREGITEESDYTLILLSRNSVASEWCKEELRMAYQKEFALKRVVLLPIRIDQSEIPPEVSTKKYYSLDTAYEESFQSLAGEIKSLVSKQSSP